LEIKFWLFPGIASKIKFKCLLCKPMLKNKRIAVSDESLFYISYMATVTEKNI